MNCVRKLSPLPGCGWRAGVRVVRINYQPRPPILAIGWGDFFGSEPPPLGPCSAQMRKRVTAAVGRHCDKPPPVSAHLILSAVWRK